MAEISKITALDGTDYYIRDRNFCVCDTAYGTAEKFVSLPGFELVEGATVCVKFSKINTAASPTLNVNSTGAKNIAVAGMIDLDLSNPAVYKALWNLNDVVEFVYDGTNWLMKPTLIPHIFCYSASESREKYTYHPFENAPFSLGKNKHYIVTMLHDNTYRGSIYISCTVSATTSWSLPIFINGEASSDTNYTLPAGTYIVHVSSNRAYFRTDDKIPGSIDGDAGTVNGHTVLSDVPANAKFTDTTYSEATQSTAGLMSASDKSKLDAGDAATVNGHTVNSDVPENAKFTDTTYSAATQSAAGLMSATDKKKLDETGNIIGLSYTVVSTF